MKIQGLIRRLETIKRKHGNLDVSVFDLDQAEKGYLAPTVALISLTENEAGTVTGVCLIDAETRNALV